MVTQAVVERLQMDVFDFLISLSGLLHIVKSQQGILVSSPQMVDQFSLLERGMSHSLPADPCHHASAADQRESAHLQ